MNAQRLRSPPSDTSINPASNLQIAIARLLHQWATVNAKHSCVSEDEI
jgi:hypothetical protein